MSRLLYAIERRVIRDCLRSDLGPVDLARLNGLPIDAIAATLPPAQPLAPTAPNPERARWQLRDGYLLDHLIDHVLAAERTASAEAVADDLRWVETRLAQRGPTAPWTDLIRIDTSASPHICTRSLTSPNAGTILLNGPSSLPNGPCLTPPPLHCAVLSATPTRCGRWRSRRTASGSPLPASTTRCGSGAFRINVPWP